MTARREELYSLKGFVQVSRSPQGFLLHFATLCAQLQDFAFCTIHVAFTEGRPTWQCLFRRAFELSRQPHRQLNHAPVCVYAPTVCISATYGTCPDSRPTHATLSASLAPLECPTIEHSASGIRPRCRRRCGHLWCRATPPSAAASLRGLQMHRVRRHSCMQHTSCLGDPT